MQPTINDTYLELLTSWKPPNGDPAQVGGTGTPTSFGYDQSFPTMRFWTQGAKYNNWLAAIARPILPNTGNLQLSFMVMFDNPLAGEVQAREFDTRVSISNWNYNFSSQINMAEGGHLQISNQSGGWVDTGIVLDLAPEAWHTFVYDYAFNVTTHKYSILSVTVDGIMYLIPTTLQNLTATQPSPPWEDSCSLQVQLDIGSAGGGFSQLMQNIQYSWS